MKYYLEILMAVIAVAIVMLFFGLSIAFERIGAIEQWTGMPDHEETE